MSSYRQAIRVQQWIAVIGIVLLAIKFYAYFITHSVAILTDALESIVNVVAGIITLASLMVAAKPRDSSHPYGHGKAEFISAGIEGSLIAVAGIWILVEAIKKFIHPAPVFELDTGLILIAICGLINLSAGWIGIRQGKKSNSVAVSASGKHLITDAISTGGLIAGLLLMKITGWQWLDSVVALIFGSILIFTGFRIVRSSIAGIMDEADEVLLNGLVAFLQKNRKNRWVDLHNLRVIKYGNRLHLDCHLTLPWYLNLHEAHKEVDALDTLIKSEFGNALEMFVHTDGCLPESCNICLMDNCSQRQHPLINTIQWTTENLFQNEKHAL
jgi:cation diffusion facilitator family transporter